MLRPDPGQLVKCHPSDQRLRIFLVNKMCLSSNFYGSTMQRYIAFAYEFMRCVWGLAIF